MGKNMPLAADGLRQAPEDAQILSQSSELGQDASGHGVFERLRPFKLIRGRSLIALLLVGLVSIVLGYIELRRLWEFSRLVDLLTRGAPQHETSGQLNLVLVLFLVAQPAAFTLLIWLRVVLLGSQTSADFRGYFWDQVLHLPFSTVQRIGSGRLTSHGWMYPTSVLQIGGSFLSDISYLAAFLIYLFVLVSTESILLLIPILLWIVLVLTLSLVVALPLQRLSQALQDATASMNSAAVDFLNNYALLRLMPWEKLPSRNLQSLNQEFEKRSTKVAKLEVGMNSGANFINAACTGLGVWFLVHDGSLDGAQKLSMLVFFVPLMLQLNGIAEIALGSVSGALGAFGSLSAFRADLTDTDNAPPALQVSAAMNGEIRADALALRPQGMEHPVFTGACFTIVPGSTVGIVGPSGAGKSTLMLAIAGLLRPDAGTLVVGARAAKVVICTQVPQLLSISLRANLAFGNNCTDPVRFEEALRLVALDSLLDTASNPDGLDMVISLFGENLSGGQRQRIALARALLARPDILLLDEALSGVETDLEHSIMARVRVWLPHATILISSHRGHSLTTGTQILKISGKQLTSERFVK
jgi:ATP-binding cassette subfamily B protein